MTAPLAWSLVVATYRRIEALEICVRLALAQTRPPLEVVIVDAGPDWAENRDRVAPLCAAAATPLTYLRSEVASLTVQRNAGVAAARGDVVFLIDDDSFMHPDCAAEVMRVYDADAAGAVAGVQTEPVAENPAAGEGARPGGAPAARKRRSPFRDLARRGALARFVMSEVLLMNRQKLFIPYDGPWRTPPIPPAVAGLAVKPARLFFGFRMTFRRAVALREPFDATLRFNCPVEDLDGSYRAARHGALLTALRARVHHFESASGRVDRRRLMLLTALNLAVLLRRNAADLPAARRAHAALTARRLLAEALKDALSGRFALPQFRAALAAAPLARRILRADAETVSAWWPLAQADLAAGRPMRPLAAATPAPETASETGPETSGGRAR